MYCLMLNESASDQSKEQKNDSSQLFLVELLSAKADVRILPVKRQNGFSTQYFRRDHGKSHFNSS